jgi:hypothetical protein
MEQLSHGTALTQAYASYLWYSHTLLLWSDSKSHQSRRLCRQSQHSLACTVLSTLHRPGRWCMSLASQACCWALLADWCSCNLQCKQWKHGVRIGVHAVLSGQEILHVDSASLFPEQHACCVLGGMLAVCWVVCLLCLGQSSEPSRCSTRCQRHVPPTRPSNSVPTPPTLCMATHCSWPAECRCRLCFSGKCCWLHMLH